YVIAGSPASGLAKAPQVGNPTTGASRTVAVPTANSTNFWESYMADDGPFGSSHVNGNLQHAGTARAGTGGWDPNHWNSARCDTAGNNVFPFLGRGAGIPPSVADTWSGTYHESEFGIAPAAEYHDTYPFVPNRRSNLGTPRHRCFVKSAGA